jgi:hypothetical protein
MTVVPRSLGEVYDLLGAMSISGPLLTSTMFPEQNVRSCFEQLRGGLEQTRSKLGDTGYQRLRMAADEAQSLYEANQHRPGVNLIQHMAEYIRLKKYKTDEPVVDESRFEPQ